MARKRYRTAIAIALISAVLAVFWRAPGAGAEQETFTTQCPGGTIEVWPSFTGTGQDSYFQGRGSVTVDFLFPESDVPQTVYVTFVAISTGPNCSEVEIRTSRDRVDGGGTSPETPSWNFVVAAGTASFGQYDSFGDYEYTQSGIIAITPSGDRYQVRSSNGEVVRGRSGQPLEVVSPDGRTCHNGRFYYGIDTSNGNTWTSGCITQELAASYGWDENNSSTTYPDHNEVYRTLSSGLPGWRYEHWVGGQKRGTLACTVNRHNLGSEYREFACTLP